MNLKQNAEYRETDRGKEVAQKWNEANREKRRAYGRKSYQKHKKKNQSYSKTYYHANKKKYQEWSKRWRRKWHYSATPEEVEIYLKDCKKQEMVCPICKKVGMRRGEPCLEYDHNHQTGEYRGAICGTCNKGLGLFQDDLFILKAAVQYLEERGTENGVKPLV